MALTDNLVSYWKLDESSDGSAPVTRNDSVASNNLTDNNTIASGVGKINNGADFESNNSEYLSIADASQTGLDVSTAVSLSAWINVETFGSTRFIAGKYTTTGNLRQYRMSLSNQKLVFSVSDDGTIADTHFQQYVSDNDVVVTGSFVFVVATFDVSTETLVMYVNGSSVAFTKTIGSTLGASIHNGTGAFTIGALGDPTDYFDGIIDEVGIWSRVLTSEEVTELYNSGDGLQPSFTPPTSIKDIIGMGFIAFPR